ncbi:uncharacterized protein C11D3.03c isoform X2 [Drosophila mojavensis]|uniref:Uncharacterized protein, isoform C n=1 Tax=Drosophila mojavensis TaxID=7230 RepID=A0A0Q9WZZ7_DROMO|nr:uncharacterized protein C11D3.03c isoform X2 [Drosophila mojavensis]KRG01269.1 uncharacterized protein Dmoj_GI24506, isoform C [Drosophila mojavensis]
MWIVPAVLDTFNCLISRRWTFVRIAAILQVVMTESKPNSWCGRQDKLREFAKHQPIICYDKPPSALVSKEEYDNKRYEALTGELVEALVVPKREARTWTMQTGDLCRITVHEGPQVGDVNFWNLDNCQERFYSGKTRQLHAAHLKVYDRLWSCLPYLRPMATFVFDTLAQYGIDEDGGALHDVIGTRCDDYTYKLITGQERVGSCHSSLVKAVVEERGMTEQDVHDVWNIFMCTGFTRDTEQYFCKPSPAQKGDFIEFVADMNLLVALSACPQGDVSIPVGIQVPDEKCHPLKVEVFRKK